MTGNGQKLTLGQASKMCGLSKPTLSKYLAQGRISGVKDDKGVWQIDPAEIARLDDTRGAAGKGRKASETVADAGAESALAVELRLTKEMLAEAREREAKALAQLETALENERAASRRMVALITEIRGESGTGLFAKMLKKFRGA